MKFTLFIPLCFLSIIISCSRNDSVVYGMRFFPESLDPLFGILFDESQISSQIYENLVELDDDCKTIKPHLAVDWDISNDKCTYTFNLRNNVYFHDGTKLTTKSVLRTYEWLKAEGSESEIFTKIKSINIIDSLTFQFVLHKPYSVFMYTLASPESFELMSENAINNLDTSIAKNPVGTGPYQIDKWNEKKSIVLKKFDKYWGNQGTVDKIVFEYNPDIFTLENDLINSEVDILYKPSSYSTDKIKRTGYIRYYTFPPINMFIMGFNNRIYPFNDIRARRAVLQGINLSRLVVTMSRGDAIIAKGPLSPTEYEYHDIVQAGYDSENSKKIIQELGLENLELTFLYPRIAIVKETPIEFLKYEFSKIGLSLKIHECKSWTDFFKNFNSDSCHLFFLGSKPDIIGDAVSLLRGFFYSSSTVNLTGYNAPLVDQWLDQAYLEHDADKHKILYDKIVKRILNDTPAIFLFHSIPNVAYNTNKIKKIAANPYGVIHFNEMELN